MADDREVQELKETLQRLERDVERLTAEKRRVRPGWLNFLRYRKV